VNVIDVIFPGEQWADFISLFVWSFTFLCIVIVTLIHMHRNKRLFDGVSFFLIAKTTLLFILFMVSAWAVWWPEIRQPAVRWTLRTIGIIFNLLLITQLIQITFPNARFVRWMNQRRIMRWIGNHSPWRTPV
jgi:hypothetical protein